MCKKILTLFFFLLFSTVALFAQTTVKNLTLSTTIKNAGTPRIVRDGFNHVWLAAWHQTGPNKIVGRIVKSDGSLNPPKTLATNVSSATQSFDIFFDSVLYNYLLAFENAKGLQVQLFSPSLQKKGQPTLIESGVSGTNPRLQFDPVSKRFLIFWISTADGVPGKALKSLVLDSNGKPVGQIQSLATAASGKTLSGLSVSVNPKNENMTVLVLQSTGTANAALIKLNTKPDGARIGTAKNLQPPTNGLDTIADASFNDGGTGFSFWSDKTSIKRRKLSLAGAFVGPTKSLPNAADTANSIQTSILFDSLNNQFIGVWGKGNSIQGAAINPVTGEITKGPFDVATNAAAVGSRDVSTSYDGQAGNAIAVWDDVTGSGAAEKFQVKGAIFFVASTSSQTGVSMGDNFYSPASITISQGTTLLWTNNGNSQHTVTSDNGVFGSGTLNRGQTFSFRFESAGTFPYHCTIHGQVMSGTVTVNQGNDGNTRY
jgi:plastocyanin